MLGLQYGDENNHDYEYDNDDDAGHHNDKVDDENNAYKQLVDLHFDKSITLCVTAKTRILSISLSSRFCSSTLGPSRD